MVAPDLREETLAADHLAGVFDEMVEETELTVGELRRMGADPCLAARHVEHERPDLEHLVALQTTMPQCHPHPRHELLERERLAEVVAGAEPEPAELRR